VAQPPDLILHDGTSDTSYNSMPPLVPIRQGIAHQWGKGAFVPYVRDHNQFSSVTHSYPPLEAGFSQMILYPKASDVSQPSVSSVMTTESSLSSLKQFQDQEARPPLVTIINKSPKKSDQSKGISTTKTKINKYTKPWTREEDEALVKYAKNNKKNDFIDWTKFPQYWTKFSQYPGFTGRTIFSAKTEYGKLSRGQSGEHLPDKGYKWHWTPEERKALLEYAEKNKKNDRIVWSNLFRQYPVLTGRTIVSAQKEYGKLSRGQSGERLPDKGFKCQWTPEERRALVEYAEKNKKEGPVDWTKSSQDPLLAHKSIASLEARYYKIKKSGERVGYPPHNAFLVF
jgi:hypothetical protein